MSADTTPQRNEVFGQLLYLGARRLETRHGTIDAHIAQNLATGTCAFALTLGDVSSRAPLLARVHSSCITSESLGGCDCDCVEQLDAALERIARAGRGIVFYLMQEGRGAGFGTKARDRMIVQASCNRVTTFEAYAGMGLEHDLRRYEEVGFLCRLLRVRAPLTLLTNNPDKLEAVRRAADVEIGGQESLSRPPSPYNIHYISSKSRSGHSLADPGGGAGATLPEPVIAFEPFALAGEPRFVLLASYFLPIRPHGNGDVTSTPHWFRLYAYFDLAAGCDRIVLAYGPGDAQRTVVRLQRESLLERFPLAATETGKQHWHACVRAMVARGAGLAAFVAPAGFAPDLRELPGDCTASSRLLAHHIGTRTSHPLFFFDESPLGDLEVLKRDGVCAGDPLVLAAATTAAHPRTTYPAEAVARK